MNKDPEFRPKWENRRRMIFILFFFCLLTISYLLFFGNESELHRDIALYTYVLLGADVAIYVLGATWDDLNFLNFIKR